MFATMQQQQMQVISQLTSSFQQQMFLAQQTMTETLVNVTTSITKALKPEVQSTLSAPLNVSVAPTISSMPPPILTPEQKTARWNYPRMLEAISENSKASHLTARDQHEIEFLLATAQDLLNLYEDQPEKLKSTRRRITMYYYVVFANWEAAIKAVAEYFDKKPVDPELPELPPK